jgi:type II secretory pathway pseudopilin PulG
MARRARPRSRVAGFTLIEAMAALAIASTIMVGVFAVMHQLIDGQRRYDAITRRANIEHDAIALVRDVNPSNVATGDLPMPPNMILHWTSEAISDPKLTTGFPRGDGNYTATLYRITVNVDDAAGHDVIPPFTLERVGWAAGNLTAPTAG